MCYITMSWYLVKIVKTHPEIIKDGGIVVVSGQISSYLSFPIGCYFRFWRNKKMETYLEIYFFVNPYASKI